VQTSAAEIDNRSAPNVLPDAHIRDDLQTWQNEGEPLHTDDVRRAMQRPLVGAVRKLKVAAAHRCMALPDNK
jgi:hypothetical protein